MTGSVTRAQIANYGIFVAFALVVIGLMIASPAFRAPENLIAIGRQVAVLGIASFAMTFIILAGEIDLSVGAVASASGVVTAMALAAGLGPWAILIGVGVGAGFGLMNGLLTVYAAVPSFIATLVSFFIAQGVALTLTGGRTILFDADWFRDFFATGSVFGLRSAFLWLFFVFLALWWLLARTRFGAHIYAIGGSQPSSRMLGLAVDRIKILIFTMAGALMGLVGMILISRIGNARSDGAVGLEFDAIAAVVIGGTALGGGTGSLLRSLIGVMLIGVLNNGLAILNVDFNAQQVIKGVLVIAVVLLDRWARGLKGASA
ncbi:MAG: ABC transporter permease [Rhizobiales bacterium]|nr:ABC transporter permease [Hyphomicrobiales bacterium]MBO6698326.1 ABC transporter permease [Hyphomicrobiales bacterium]MBO6735420.1 ABC transporter permease [Hyphomicrobiales bacterium]MBO6910772.1 ABC transporter permease [Hyphomicrobiales bacterium]MBO6956509.1 ABC transporter permease [Hyphomicrobiales bacterium]